MKKICFISTVDITLNSFVIPVAEEFKKKGFQVYLLADMSDAFFQKYSPLYTCYNVKMERGVDFKRIFTVIKIFVDIFRKEKFDLIQYATPNASLYASIAGVIANIPIRVYCQWGIRYVGFSGLKRSFFKMLEHITCKLSTSIRPASEKNREFAIQENLYNKEKSKVIGNGGAVGIDIWNYPIEEKSDLRKEVCEKYPVLNNKFIFGFVGRLEKDKGVGELLTAFIRLAKEDETIALLIVGSIDKYDSNFESLLKDAKKCKNIIFTGFSREVPKLMAAMDVYVHPSYREGFSYVIQQAMSMGVPILTTDIPGPSEVIENESSGFLVPPRDTDSLELFMKKMRNMTSCQLREMGDNGRKQVEKKYRRDYMIDLIFKDRNELLNEIL